MALAKANEEQLAFDEKLAVAPIKLGKDVFLSAENITQITNLVAAPAVPDVPNARSFFQIISQSIFIKTHVFPASKEMQDKINGLCNVAGRELAGIQGTLAGEGLDVNNYSILSQQIMTTKKWLSLSSNVRTLNIKASNVSIGEQLISQLIGATQATTVSGWETLTSFLPNLRDLYSSTTAEQKVDFSQLVMKVEPVNGTVALTIHLIKLDEDMMKSATRFLCFESSKEDFSCKVEVKDFLYVGEAPQEESKGDAQA